MHSRSRLCEHPAAVDLHAAHELYEQRERRAYAYKLGRYTITAASPVAGLGEVEAVDLLLRVWSPGASQANLLTLDVLDALLAATADARAAFVDRHITSLVESEEPAVADIYGAFREFLGPFGAAKALGLLHPRFFPLWDSKIAIHYVGHSFRQAPASYVEFAPLTVPNRT